MDEFAAVENYVWFGKYPSGMEKGNKANLRKKCNNNFKLECGLLYYKKKKSCNDAWTVCVRSEDEKKRIFKSCPSGVGGMYGIKM